MPKPIKNLTNMEIDEISLVDKGANQHAMITIAKRAPEEDDMPEIDLYAEDGSSITEDDLKHGDIVYDVEGNAYEYTEDEQDEVQEVEEAEPQLVGKSAFFEPKKDNSFTAQVLEELSKAFTDNDRDKVFAKALGRVEELEQQQHQFAEVAKAERDLRLTREYVSKAAEYNLPIAPDELGPVLYRMAETMSYEDCAVIAKALETAGEAIFEEVGYIGGGENGDVFDEVVSRAATVSKSDNPSASDISGVFDINPEAYDDYLSAQRGRN